MTSTRLTTRLSTRPPRARSAATLPALLSVLLSGPLSAGCDDGSPKVAPSPGGGGVGGESQGGAGNGGAPPPMGGAPLDVAVPEQGLVYVDLDGPSVVGESASWELAFEGASVYTNGGASGDGDGAAFGPLAAAAFLADVVPDHPFMLDDRTGGAFLDWYEYEGATHTLWSRYHVVGVRRGDALYKVQVLGYYGELAGAPTSALYHLRFASVTEAGSGPTLELENVDATAGGPSGTDDDPSACLSLASGQWTLMTPLEALASDAWDLCFRRASISVNGGAGGPGGVEAVDLDAAAMATETLDEVKLRSAASQLSRFSAVGYAELSSPGLAYSGDGVVSAFHGKWLDADATPLAPEPATWLVRGADGASHFLVAFEGFSGATAQHPGTVRLLSKRVGD
jgi:hypothetical protein